MVQSVFQSMHPADQDNVLRIMELLDQASAKASAFVEASGLNCARGCGKCCSKPNIETTVLELMPLAIALWDQGIAEEALARLMNAEHTCIFYKPDPVISGNGRCSVYNYRPGVCRLFGSSTRKDKYNHPTLVTCRVIKENLPKECAQAEEHIKQGLSAPSMSDHAFEVYRIDPHLGKELMPINQAAHIALERVGWKTFS